jgi:hypothetical protein
VTPARTTCRRAFASSRAPAPRAARPPPAARPPWQNPERFFLPIPENYDTLQERVQDLEKEQDRLQGEIQKQQDCLQEAWSASKLCRRGLAC